MENLSHSLTNSEMQKNWQESARWKGIVRNYSTDEVLKLRPSIPVRYTLAEIGAKKFWEILQNDGYTNALGALTGAQAVNMVKAGLKAIYLSGWQVAADANQSSQTYPDQSLYPSNSAPALVKRIQNALMRAEQIERVEGTVNHDWYVPILADAEAGFGGPLHAFELMKSMIEAGAGAVHFEDQLASEKKCGHLGGKVLVPTSQFIKTLTAARLASDVCGVPSVIVARTDALAAKLLTSDIDEYDRQFISGDRTPEGFYRIKDGLESAIARGLAYAPYADVLWFETSYPDINEAQKFAEAIHANYPGKPLTYNCSPSFHWSKHLDDDSIASFQRDLGQLGFKFQFITLAGWHLLNYHTFDLARAYRDTGMSAYVDLQNKEFGREAEGYTATKHQREVGTGYFDQVLMAVTQGKAETAALKGSTEAEQFDSGVIGYKATANCSPANEAELKL
ncbi:MAG: isocitrate lyase [Oligoflexales bacterium]